MVQMHHIRAETGLLHQGSRRSRICRVAKGSCVMMGRLDSRWKVLSSTLPVALSLGIVLLVELTAAGCRRTPRTVAVIPRTCGTALWEPEHAGAAAVARSIGLNLYWNAPMRDNDVQTQISLVEKSLDRGVAGIIVSPIETLPMRTPMRRVLARGVPAVVIDTELGIPPGPRLGYVLNDEDAGGRIAARRVGAILHGQGNLAVVGIDPQLKSSLARERSFETTLRQEFPGIRVAVRRLAQSTVPQEQHDAEELLAGNVPIDAIVALTLAATRGTYYALVEFGKAGVIKLVGFDQDLLPPIRTGGIDSVVVQNTFEIGRIAMDLVDREIQGTAGSAEVYVQPVLMTRDNVDSAEIRQILNLSWWSPQ